MQCPACAQPLPEGARFCPACGHSLAPPAHDERRVVTVLFADVVGFTTLAERRDPEQVKRLVDDAFARLVADVETFGGRVDKVLGDAIVALFGAPVAHEDDAERAVRAGLRMHETLARFAAEVPGLEEVRLRVGINTGEVLVGTLAGTDYTAMGDVVNTAARLQALAPPGGVLIGDATRALCSDAVVAEALAPAQLRGREQVEQVWLVAGVDPGGRRRRRSPSARFVGRGLERTVLASLTESVRRGRSALVSVSGEAGIGKSRLVDEVLDGLRRVEPHVVVLEGACSPYGDDNVWAPISTAIAQYLGIDRTRSVGEIRDVASTRSVGVLGVDPTGPAAPEELEALLHLLGHPSELDRLDPAGARDVLFGTVIAGLRRRAASGPVVLWIDDLQWAHQLLVDLLEVIVRSTVGLPVMVVTAARPDDDTGRASGRWPPLVDRVTTFQLPLDPLDDVESCELVDVVTGGRVPAELRTRISERSGGNPLFLTELAMLALTDEAELPGSLRALIASRLDRLGAEERTVIANAAIVGSEGPVSALEEFADAMRQRFDRSLLDSLVAGGLLEVDGDWWRFRSDVVREVAYQTVTKHARAQRHAGVARVMSIEEDPPLDKVAHHAATAAELLAELGTVSGVDPSIRTEAIGLLARAAKRSYDLGGYRHGAEQTRRALALAGDDRESRASLLVLHATGLVELRSLDDAAADLDDALGAARAAGDRVIEGEALRLLGMVSQQRGDLVTAREHLGAAVDIFREIDDPPRLALALRARGFAEVLGGSLQDAEWYLGEADALYEELGDQRGRAWVAQHRSWITFLSGDHAAAERRLDEAIATFERIGDHSGVNWSRGLLAYVQYFQRRFDVADALAREVLVEARQWGDEWGAAMMLTLTANLRLWSGRFPEAVQAAEQALVGFRRIGDRFGTLQALAAMSRARAAMGRTTDAERAIEEIIAVSNSFGSLALPTIAASGVAMHLGDGARTVDYAEQAIARLDTTGANIDEASVQLACGLLQSGRPDDAIAVLDSVDVVDQPFAAAVRALNWAAIGDLDAALADAEAVLAMDNPSYFDRSLALAAAAAAASRRGDADSERRIAALTSTSAGAGDVLVAGFLRAVAGRLTGDATGASPSSGWGRVAALISGVDVAEPVEAPVDG